MSSATATSPARSPGKGSSSTLLRAIIILVVVLTTAMLVGSVIVATGKTRGEEFAPETFQRRTFHYYRLPLVGLQLTAVHRDDKTGTLEKHLAANDLLGWTLPPGQQPRWHLVFEKRGDFDPRHGDAAILCTYLDLYAEGNFVSLAWTEANPELAKVFWPTIAEVARHELYIWIPELMNIPKGVREADELQQRIDEFLIVQYVDFAKEQQQIGQYALAIELLQLALARDPGNVRASQLRRDLEQQRHADGSRP